VPATGGVVVVMRVGAPGAVAGGGTRRRRRPGAGEAGVARVLEEEVLQEPAAAEEARAHGAHGDAEHGGGLLVRLPLDVHEHHRHAVVRRDGGERPVDGRTQIHALQHRRHPGALRRAVGHGRGQRLELGVVVGRLDVARVAPRGAQERVATDGEQPALRVGAVVERVPAAERLQIRLLHEVVGPGRVARERAGEARHVAQERHGQPLERRDRRLGARAGRPGAGRPGVGGRGPVGERTKHAGSWGCRAGDRAGGGAAPGRAARAGPANSAVGRPVASAGVRRPAPGRA
jgi:hypothetical protein